MKAPRSTYAYRLPSNWTVRTVDAVIGLIERHKPVLCLVAIFAIWAFAMDSDYHEQVRAADARTAEATAWAAGKRVKVTLEGEPGTVANMALQVSAAVRP